MSLDGVLVSVLGAGLLAWALVAALQRGHAMTRGQAAAVAAACASTWLANVLLTSGYFVDVLQLDAWESVALVEHLRGGSFAAADLWAAHNEHRPMTGRLVALLCAQAAHWNHWWEFAALHLVAAAQVVALAWQAARPGGAWRTPPLTIVAIVACFTATMHWETWLRGFSIHILLGVLAPTLALRCLCRGRPGWPMLGVAALLALVGLFSFGASLLLWPLGAAVLAVRGGRDRNWLVGAWLLAGALATALYVPGLHVHPGATANAALAFGPAGLARMAVGVLVTVGTALWYAPAVFAAGPSWAQVAVVGMAGGAVSSWVVLVWRRWRADEEGTGAWLFPTALGAFGLGACVLVSVGRVAGGLLALAASRYLVFAACFWASWLLLLGMGTDATASRRQRRVSALSLVVVLAMVINSIASVPFMAAESARLARAREQLLQGDVGAASHVLYPDPHKLAHMRDVLQRYRLSLFRPRGR